MPWPHNVLSPLNPADFIAFTGVCESLVHQTKKILSLPKVQTLPYNYFSSPIIL